MTGHGWRGRLLANTLLVSLNELLKFGEAELGLQHGPSAADDVQFSFGLGYDLALFKIGVADQSNLLKYELHLLHPLVEVGDVDLVEQVEIFGHVDVHLEQR